jgi:response regulator RpfG family c-di-GMP phosphodiesterase
MIQKQYIWCGRTQHAGDALRIGNGYSYFMSNPDLGQGAYVMEKTFTTLIISEAKRERESLRAILSSFPWMGLVLKSDSALEAEGVVKGEKPDLVVITLSGSNDQILEEVRKIKQCLPQARYLVVAELTQCSPLQQSAEIDHALDWGFKTMDLYKVVQSLLFPDGVSGQTAAAARQFYSRTGLKEDIDLPKQITRIKMEEEND